MRKKLRILMAKPGLDGHDRGIKVLCRAMRDAGYEVIYTGLRRTPEEIVNAAVQEDVSVLGISLLSGAHNVLVPQVIALLKEKGVSEEIRLILGGIIPESDIPELKASGVSEVFLPGTSMNSVLSWIEEEVIGVPEGHQQKS